VNSYTTKIQQKFILLTHHIDWLENLNLNQSFLLNMLIFRTNPFDRKTYTYNSPLGLEDILGNEMDDNLHSNKRLINRHRYNSGFYTLTNKPGFVCPYCDQHFSSRSLLRNHLGFMGIDIRNKNIQYKRKPLSIKKRRSDVKIVELEEDSIDELFKKLKL
jgi:hypothetical protein